MFLIMNGVIYYLDTAFLVMPVTLKGKRNGSWTQSIIIIIIMQ